jgi:outer membrane biosynthesis protein TonB
VFYQRPPSVSFQMDALPAFVSMKDGRFQFAILASCGNAVMATPRVVASKPRPAAPAVQPTPAPSPTPPPAAPAQMQSQSQNQQVVVQAPPATAAAAPTPAPTPAPAPVAQPLPNTGPTGLVGVFAVSSIVGTFGYRHWLVRRH